MALMWSVTEPKVWPGAITGGRGFSPGPSASLKSGVGILSSVLLLLLLVRRRSFQLRVGIADFGQIGGARPGVELGQQPVVAGLGLEAGHAALGIVDVAED